MTFDDETLENLLHQPEGTTLDFKQEQYRFNGATDDEKSELLKDILALANSWRRSTAYILVGVIDGKGSRSEIIGINEHLEDHNLQEFVNAKIQRPLAFSYRRYLIGGKEIGVIQIPIQPRPFYLTKPYGKLKADVVKVRHGSSTRDASLPEIEKMLVETHFASSPYLALEWANIGERTVLPSPCEIRSVILYPPLPLDTFQPPRRSSIIDFPTINHDYSQELIVHIFQRSCFTPLGFRLKNVGNVPGRRIKFVGKITKREGLCVLDHFESLPSPTRDFMPSDLSISDFRNENLSGTGLERSTGYLGDCNRLWRRTPSR